MRYFEQRYRLVGMGKVAQIIVMPSRTIVWPTFIPFPNVT
jgi:hypothetical protein